MRQERAPLPLRAALASILAAAAVGCESTSAPSSSEEMSDPTAPVGQLELMLGGVLLERGKASHPAELGYLYVKDVLETQEDGRATVRFAGNRTLEIQPHARVTIGADKGSLLLRVIRGALSVQVGSPSASSPFDFWGEHGSKSWLGVHTPYGVARMAPGRNALSLAMISDSAHLKALSGSVEVFSRSGQATELTAGQQLTLTLSK
jgi:ferric-dicitrate binding protein FerR (iron transport regulator)